MSAVKSVASLAVATALLSRIVLGQATDKGAVTTAEKLNRAKAAYSTGVKNAQGPVLKQFTKLKKAAQDRGDLEGLKALQVAESHFKERNEIPDGLSAKDFRRQLTKLQGQMVDALVKAKQDYTRIGEIAKAEAVAAELDRFRTEAQGAPSRRGPDQDSFLSIKTNIGLREFHEKTGSFRRDLGPEVSAFVTAGRPYLNVAAGKENVLCTHPLQAEVPAVIDFGGLTAERTGRLRLMARSYPALDGSDVPGGRIVVKVDGQIVSDDVLNEADGWREIVVPFQGNNIVVEHHAIGWQFEFMFFDYRILPDVGATRKSRSRGR